MRRKSVTIKQIQDLDKRAIKGIGVPSLALMENAGRGVAREVLKTVKNKKNIYVVCGVGNNAGDGFVVARHLLNAGKNVKVALIGKAGRLKDDAAANYKVLKKLKYPVKETDKVTKSVIKDIKGAACVVDAIFGVGLNREIRDPFKSFVEAINAHAKKVVAVDVPSGLDGTSGKVYGVCVKAQKTVTFSFAKKGFTKALGPAHTGRVVVIDIGIPKKLQDRI